MKDRTGRDLAIGQVVELLADGMLSAVVVKIQEGGLIGEGGRRQPAMIVVQIGVPFELEPGDLAPMYITKEADMRRLGEEKTKKGRVN